MVIKIAIHGKANSGKDTLAKILAAKLESKTRHPGPGLKLAFADPIKEIAEIMFPQVPRDVWWGPSPLRSTVIDEAYDSDGNKLTARRLLTDLGKKGRKYNQNIWINAVLHKIKENLGFVVISDLRFKNEFAALKENNFFLIKLVRKSNISKSKDESEVDLDDVSNDNFDYLINNDKSLEDLNESIDDLVHFLTFN